MSSTSARSLTFMATNLISFCLSIAGVIGYIVLYLVLMAAFNIKDVLFLDAESTKSIGSTPLGQDQKFFLIFWTLIKNLYVLTGIILLFFLIAGGLGMIINAG